jgi:hypothetical protein
VQEAELALSQPQQQIDDLPFAASLAQQLAGDLRRFVPFDPPFALLRGQADAQCLDGAVLRAADKALDEFVRKFPRTCFLTALVQVTCMVG